MSTKRMLLKSASGATSSKYFSTLNTSNTAATRSSWTNPKPKPNVENSSWISVYDYPTPLYQGRLIRRYKRFLADVRLVGADGKTDDASIITVYCPNTGPMVGLLPDDHDDTIEPLVYLSKHDTEKSKRKYAYTLEMIESMDGWMMKRTTETKNWVGIHSALANKCIHRALELGILAPYFPHIKHIHPEVAVVKGSRVDFVLDHEDESRQTIIEVKSVTLTAADDPHCAVFPDTVSTRAQKHVEELIHLVTSKASTAAALIFVIQRSNCQTFSPSFDDDPAFTRLCQSAHEKGIQLLVLESRFRRIHSDDQEKNDQENDYCPDLGVRGKIEICTRAVPLDSRFFIQHPEVTANKRRNTKPTSEAKKRKPTI